MPLLALAGPAVNTLHLDSPRMGAITDLAESINDARRSIWGDASTVGKILILAVLIASGIGIPVIIIALIAQAIAE